MKKRNLYFILLGLLFLGCNEEKSVSVTEPAGTNMAISEYSLQETYQNLTDAVNRDQGMSIMNEVDFANNARGMDRELSDVRVVFMGNPEAGTALIQQNQLAALDLPQHIVLYEKDDEVYAVYNSMQYLESRYQLSGVPELQNMAGKLEELVRSATGTSVREAADQDISTREGIVTVESVNNFQQTQMTLRNSLEENTNIRIIAEIDHTQNAAGAGMELRPTSLYLVSNPNLETGILDKNPGVALDFPHKILVWEDSDGSVKISYNDPDFLEQRYQMDASDIALAELSGVFNDIVNYAASDHGEYDQPEDQTIEFDTEPLPGAGD